MKMATLTATLLCRIDVQGKINVQVEKLQGELKKHNSIEDLLLKS
jgi:hypothetical protein